MTVYTTFSLGFVDEYFWKLNSLQPDKFHNTGEMRIYTIIDNKILKIIRLGKILHECAHNTFSVRKTQIFISKTQIFISKTQNPRMVLKTQDLGAKPQLWQPCVKHGLNSHKVKRLRHYTLEKL